MHSAKRLWIVLLSFVFLWSFGGGNVAAQESVKLCEQECREGFSLFYNGRSSMPTCLYALDTSMGRMYAYRLSAWGEASFASFAPVELSGYEAFSLPVRQRLNVILKHSYPALDLAKLRSFCGADDLCLAEAICVSQALIWKYTCGIEVNTAKLTMNSRKYYYALEALPNERFAETHTSFLQICSTLSEVSSQGASYSIIYRCLAKEGTLFHTYSDSLDSLGIQETIHEQGRQKRIELKNIPVDTQLSLTFSLYCELPRRAYVLEGERSGEGMLIYASMPYGEEKTIRLCPQRDKNSLSRLSDGGETVGAF